MSDKSAIEWTDATWNPVTGCTKVSPGCDRCYAETFAERFRGVPGHHFEQGFDLVLRPERLDQPLRWTKPRRIFVNSMSDLFHKDVPDDYIVDVFKTMWWAPQHTFQVLTKRHGRMRSLLPRIETALRQIEGDLALVDCPTPLTWPLPNVWLGVSVEDQRWADIRIPALLDTPAAVRWVSAEPLLGPVYLAIPLAPRWDGGPRRDSALVEACGVCNGWGTDCGIAGTHFVRRSNGLDWVVAGGESGPGARPMHPDWARSLRDQCSAAGVPFLFKQWGEWAPGDSRDYGDVGSMRRVGKKAAGRELDGRTWDEYPADRTAVPA